MRWVIYVCWLIATLATLGALFYSEVLHIEPCALCWAQRVCLFPLAFILAIATHQGFYGIAPYVFPSALGSLLFSGYQVAIQTFPGWAPINTCGTGPNCTTVIPIGLGPISIPMLSLAASTLLFVLICILWAYSHIKGKYAKI
jgi:disulfide bond formation protein DsbB